MYKFLFKGGVAVLSLASVATGVTMARYSLSPNDGQIITQINTLIETKPQYDKASFLKSLNNIPETKLTERVSVILDAIREYITVQDPYAVTRSSWDSCTRQEQRCSVSIDAYTTMSSIPSGIVAQDGHTVIVDYIGRVDSVQIFDTSIESVSRNCDHYVDQRDYKLGLSVHLGKKQMIPGFEQALYGMQMGQKKSLLIRAQDAYGERNESLVIQIPRVTMPEGGWEIGDVLSGPGIFGLEIVDMDSENFTVDTNHPLAGKDLIFDIIVREVY